MIYSLFNFIEVISNGKYEKDGDYDHFLVRFDKDKNERISIDEFCNAVMPSDFLTINMQ